MPEAVKPPRKSFRYYDLVMAAFVCGLLCADIIGASKVTKIGPFTLSAGVLFFPISYAFGDVLTEVYGYARSRKVVWAGFVALGFASLMSAIIVALPAAPGFTGEAAVEQVFGATPRIVVASFIAYFVGEFTNSYVLAKMKIWTSGRHLWTRTIGSTVVGEFIDSLLFYPIAFLGVWSTELVLRVLVTNYAVKVLWEVLATPLTYKIVAFLKRVEQEDYYDRDTNFSPFILDV